MKRWITTFGVLALTACNAAPTPETVTVTEAVATPDIQADPIGAYMIVQGKGFAPGELAEYAAALPPIYDKYEGYYVAFDSNVDVAEGDQDYLTTIISAWPSKEAARAFWDSPEYREAIKLREGIGTFDVSIVGALPAN